MHNTLGALALAIAFLVLVHLAGIIAVEKPVTSTPEYCAQMGSGWAGYPNFGCAYEQ